MSALRFLVFGRVQGVGFRYAAREAAIEYGVSGWVRNLPDGSVEIVAQGTRDAIELFVRWAEGGPRHAAVQRVIREPQDSVEGLSGFEIRR